MTLFHDAAMNAAGLTSRPVEPHHYSKLENGDWSDTESVASGQQISLRRSFTRVRIWGLSIRGLISLACAMAILMLLAFAGSCEEASRPWDGPFPPVPPQLPSLPPDSKSDPSKLKFSLILPADDPGPNLCKVLFSLEALGYPAPVIVNWGREFGKTKSSIGTSHLGKIDGVLGALDNLLSDSAPEAERLGEDDLVMVIDAYDVWFQLPPSVLIERYHAQNALAEARLRGQWTPSPNDTNPSSLMEPLPRQSIIMSSQKKCYPPRHYGYPVRCDAMPPSPLPPDLFGPYTDTETSIWEMRPRWPNSGGMMGPAGEMQRMFRQAQKLVEAGHIARGSDQGVFSEVMGEQEVWRRRAEKLNAKVDGLVKKAGGETRVTLDAETAAEMEELRRDRHREYGIGLDYVQELFPPTVFSDFEGVYLRFNDSAEVTATSIAHEVFPVRLYDLPDDIKRLPSPLAVAGLLDEKEAAESDAAKWNQVPIYANFWLATIPVAVHHNAHHGGKKPIRLRDWWAMNWFFPYLRDIVSRSPDQRRSPSSTPLATIPGRDDDLVYWSAGSDAQQPLPRFFSAEPEAQKTGFVEPGWDTLCSTKGHGEWEDEVFQDGKGPLKMASGS